MEENFCTKNNLNRVLIPKNKSGTKIHIKKKNKGKFTNYCGGKVTDECIQKGKKSSNNLIKKRAIFAENARRWEHKEGGNLLPRLRHSWGKTYSVLDDNGKIDRKTLKLKKND